MARKRRKRRPRQPAPSPAAKAGEGQSAPSPTERQAASPPSRLRQRPQIEDERPPAPWGSFPLVELVVLVALVMLVAGFFIKGTSGAVVLGTGLTLGALAGLELSIREHLGGYRSHTALLAAAAGIATMALLFYAFPDLVSPSARLIVAAIVAGLAALGLVRVFRDRSGRAFKVR
jgi:hypothetical protein